VAMGHAAVLWSVYLIMRIADLDAVPRCDRRITDHALGPPLRGQLGHRSGSSRRGASAVLSWCATCRPHMRRAVGPPLPRQQPPCVGAVVLVATMAHAVASQAGAGSRRGGTRRLLYFELLAPLLEHLGCDRRGGDDGGDAALSDDVLEKLLEGR